MYILTNLYAKFEGTFELWYILVKFYCYLPSSSGVKVATICFFKTSLSAFYKLK